MVFVATAALWIFRVPLELEAFTIPGWSGPLGRLLPGHDADDAVVAVTMGLALFVIPSGSGGAILTWEGVRNKVPWDVLLLFGGGFALADAVARSGLSEVIGRQFGFLAAAPPVLVVLGCAALVTALTEVASNTATAQILLPLAAGVAVGARMDPRIMMLPVAVAASCGFMLPAGTPPNAIVFGSGHVSMRAMMRAGLAVDLLGIVLVALACYVLGPWAFGIDYHGGLPEWARPE
jgi:sodium-dependent dicarboxylate transporter 2/3/5